MVFNSVILFHWYEVTPKEAIIKLGKINDFGMGYLPSGEPYNKLFWFNLSIIHAL